MILLIGCAGIYSLVQKENSKSLGADKDLASTPEKRVGRTIYRIPGNTAPILEVTIDGCQYLIYRETIIPKTIVENSKPKEDNWDDKK